MTRTAALLTVLVALGVAAGVHAGGAAPARVAIVGLEISGDGAPELRAQLQRSLAGGVAAGGAAAVELEAVLAALREVPELIGCTSTTCLARVGELVGADRFLRARIDATGSSFGVEIELYDAERGAIARFEQSCDVCTLTEVNDLVSKAAADLVSGRAGVAVSITIVSDPPGAQLRVDGDEVGAAPYQGQLSPGPHQVGATAPGRLPAETTITVVPGQLDQQFQVTLAPGPAPPPAPRERPFRRLKWAAAAGAVAALATGMVLIAADGDGTCQLTGADRQCPNVRDSATAGWLGVGAGAALGGAAGWMFVRDRRDRRPAAGLSPAEGGATVTIRLTF